MNFFFSLAIIDREKYFSDGLQKFNKITTKVIWANHFVLTNKINKHTNKKYTRTHNSWKRRILGDCTKEV